MGRAGAAGNGAGSTAMGTGTGYGRCSLRAQVWRRGGYAKRCGGGEAATAGRGRLHGGGGGGVVVVVRLAMVMGES
ncbi:hypothetical protein J1614_010547 [Plenodomus biglobosus]|nr:hypothetical protein J1614_010547 [Plenodomus biglobosus]